MDRMELSGFALIIEGQCVPLIPYLTGTPHTPEA